MWRSILSLSLTWCLLVRTMSAWMMDLDDIDSEGPDPKKAREGGPTVPGHVKMQSLEKKCHILNLKMNLNSHQQLREVAQVTRTCWMIPTDTPIIADGIKTNLQYHKTVTRLGKGHKKGDPHMYLWPTLLNHVVLKASDPKNKVPLEEYLELCKKTGTGKEHIMKSVAICRLKKCKKQENLPSQHLLFVQGHPTGYNFMVHFAQVLEEDLGAVHMWSKAPPSAMERDAQLLLKQLKA